MISRRLFRYAFSKVPEGHFIARSAASPSKKTSAILGKAIAVLLTAGKWDSAVAIVE